MAKRSYPASEVRGGGREGLLRFQVDLDKFFAGSFIKVFSNMPPSKFFWCLSRWKLPTTF